MRQAPMLGRHARLVAGASGRRLARCFASGDGANTVQRGSLRPGATAQLFTNMHAICFGVNYV